MAVSLYITPALSYYMLRTSLAAIESAILTFTSDSISSEAREALTLKAAFSVDAHGIWRTVILF